MIGSFVYHPETQVFKRDIYTLTARKTTEICRIQKVNIPLTCRLQSAKWQCQHRISQMQELWWVMRDVYARRYTPNLCLWYLVLCLTVIYTITCIVMSILGANTYLKCTNSADMQQELCSTYLSCQCYHEMALKDIAPFTYFYLQAPLHVVRWLSKPCWYRGQNCCFSCMHHFQRCQKLLNMFITRCI